MRAAVPVQTANETMHTSALDRHRPRLAFALAALLMLALTAAGLSGCGEGGLDRTASAQGEGADGSGLHWDGAGTVRFAPAVAQSAVIVGPRLDERPATHPAPALETAIKKTIAGASFGDATVAVLIAAPDGRLVYGRSAHVPVTPASNQKLATTAALLDSLGPDFQFVTLLRATAAVPAGPNAIVPGDLVVVGDGDPAIGGRFEPDNDPTGPFRRWARSLRELGIAGFAGDLVLDATLFDQGAAAYTHAGWPQDQLLDWYSAPVAALSLADNCVTVRVTPGSANGKRATVDLIPAGAADCIDVDASVTTSGSGNPIISFARPAAGQLRVRGSIPATSVPFVCDVAVDDPVRLFGTVLLATLREEGVRVDGDLLIRSEPFVADESAAPTLLAHRTPVEQVVAVTNTRSQNCWAEHCFKRAGAIGGGAGSFETGAIAVRAFLNRLGVPRDEATPVDGSGLARDNAITVAALIEILLHMADDHPAGEIFFDSLATSGDSDGTLRRRLIGPLGKGRVHAKTGTINRADALSGYVEAKDGKPWPFALVVNSHPKGHAAARALMDDLVCDLIRHLWGE